MTHGRTIEEAQSVQGPLGEGSELVGSRDLSRVAGILVAIAQRLVNGKSREDGNGDDGGIRAGVDRGPG